MICRKNLNSNFDRCVCSEHFLGKRKTYENNIQTIVPKKITAKVCKERKSRNSLRLEIPENEGELSEMKSEIEALKKKLHEKDLELQEIDLRT